MATPYIPGRIDFSLKAVHIPTINQSGEGVYVTGPHAGKSVSEIDPWVKVGTTTIDGTFHQVREVFGETWDNVEHMRYHLAAGDVWGIGGRSLMIKDRDVFDDVVIISCDIVRRLSECCDYCDRDHLTDAQRERAGECSSCSASIAAKMSSPASVKPTCPECGPHGNRGEVLLASSWAKCTTCAGGKPGDLWGEVKADKPPLRIWGVDVNANPSYEELRAAMSNHLKDFEIASGIRAPDGRSFMDARREALLVQLGQGFKVPTLSEGDRVVDRWGRTGVVVSPDKSWPGSVRVLMDAGWTGVFSLREIAGKVDVRSEVKREALRDLRNILLDRSYNMSKEDFRRMVLGGGTVP